MRIIYICLKGYIGIYNGLGLNEIAIDLSQSRHKIVVLSGMNGCGKSTLLRAMSILPDNSNEFIPGMPASKHIKLIDGDNLYEILLSSGVSKSGRGVSKASIIKNGIELNPNGNITSYKEIIFHEFDLDANFITLSRLSSDDRGLADKSPAERKRFMGFIIDNLEVYNEMYKTLTKKSSLYKAQINSLHTKIQNIGDEDNIKGAICTLTAQKQNINSSIDNIRDQISAAKARIAMNDPNGELQSQYEMLDKKSKEQQDLVNSIYKSLKKKCVPMNIESDIEVISSYVNEQTKLLNSYNASINTSTITRKGILDKLNIYNASRKDKEDKITKLSADIDDTLMGKITQYREKVNFEVGILNSIGINDPDNTTKEELLLVYNSINTILDLIESELYYEASPKIIDDAMHDNKANRKETADKVNALKDEQGKIRARLAVSQADKRIMDILNNRPSECKIDSCHFIEEAFNLQVTKYSKETVDKAISYFKTRLETITEELAELSKLNDYYEIVSNKRICLDKIYTIINQNASIFDKYEFSKSVISDIDTKLLNMTSFNKFKDDDSMLEKINTIIIYKEDIKILRDMESTYVSQKNSLSMLSQLRDELAVIVSQTDKVAKDLDDINREISNYTNLASIISTKLNAANDALQTALSWKTEMDTLTQYQMQLNDISKRSKDSIDTLQRISALSSEESKYRSKIPDIDNKLSIFAGQLHMLDQYKRDYDEYSNNYNLIEKIKKYCSPTEGIQTLFINIYMSKTLQLANDVLGMIFQGQYRLLDYVINSNEFRIPFIGNGMIVDDISSGSTSQVCMMGMVMNLVLLYQASARYNITRLDEIDGGLDTRNRFEFINVLYKVIDILGIEQLFIISHSLELELSNVDLICLKSYGEIDYTPNSNILYNFNLEHYNNK